LTFAIISGIPPIVFLSLQNARQDLCDFYFDHVDLILTKESFAGQPELLQAMNKKTNKRTNLIMAVIMALKIQSEINSAPK
jgi:hypothetical protein